MNTSDKTTSRLRRVMSWRGGVLLLLLVLGVGLWGPVLVAEGIRLAVSQWLGGMGLQLEIRTVEAEWGRPLQWKEVRVWPQIDGVSRTEIRVAELEMEFNAPWKLPFKDANFLRTLRIQGLRASVDLEKPAGTWRALPNWPEQVELQGPELQIFTPAGRATCRSLVFNLSEQALGRISAAHLELESRERRIAFEKMEGVTAWKNGNLYLADLALGEDLKLENFRLDLARRSGPELGVEATVFGGSLRADVAFEAGGVDAALWVSKLDLKPVSDLLGLVGKAEGILREGRFTFRGKPRSPRDGQASLRLVADGFRWNKRGWEALTVAASFTHRRLVVSDFSLRQKENTVRGNGEVSLEEAGVSLSRAPFLMNVSASIQDLGALSALLGRPFEETSGRMSLSSAVSGRGGRIDGYLSVETAPMVIRGRKFESGRVEVTIKGTEAEVTQCEFWSGEDHFEGSGTIALRAPHSYAGKIEILAHDFGAYAKVLPWPARFPVLGGKGHLEWEGDGTWTYHSGAFAADLDGWMCPLTPAGLTGTFAGTYSPENIYFGTLNLQHGTLALSTRATLARSGAGLQDGVLREGKKILAEGEIFIPVDLFAFLGGAPLGEIGVAEKALYLRLATRKPLPLRSLAEMLGCDLVLGGTIDGTLEITGEPGALQGEGQLTARDLSWRGAQTIQGLSGSIGFDGPNLKIGPLRGSLDSGPFVLQGRGDLAGKAPPSFVLDFWGRDMRRNPAAKTPLRADAEWRVSRQAAVGNLNGFVRLRGESEKFGSAGFPNLFAAIWSPTPRFKSQALRPFGPWESSLVFTIGKPIPFFDRFGQEWVWPGASNSLAAIFAVPQWHHADHPL